LKKREPSFVWEREGYFTYIREGPDLCEKEGLKNYREWEPQFADVSKDLEWP